MNISFRWTFWFNFRIWDFFFMRFEFFTVKHFRGSIWDFDKSLQSSMLISDRILPEFSCQSQGTISVHVHRIPFASLLAPDKIAWEFFLKRPSVLKHVRPIMAAYHTAVGHFAMVESHTSWNDTATANFTYYNFKTKIMQILDQIRITRAKKKKKIEICMTIADRQPSNWL